MKIYNLLKHTAGSRKALAATFLTAIITLLCINAPLTTQAGSRFEAGEGRFMLDGKPITIKAAELHYPRIPRAYWDQRIKLCKALGMNTVCLYTFWNVHEPQPGVFDFTGNNDLREFIKLCQANDMLVILRPGPYVCAEWEMGGLPWWLLKDKDIRLRENDPYFLERVGLFQDRVAAQTADLSIDNGGPLIMVQVENEYGSYGKDKPYVANIRDMLRKRFGKDMTLFQCDWSSNFLDNGLDDLVWTMNFGAGADVDAQFAKLKEVRPDSPLMCSEYWSGWFDKWGANHETRPAAEMVDGIDKMLAQDISFSLYMTHGGTNWGHWAGANSPGYAPDVTSYDYDAPITESGQINDKYTMLRDLLAKYNGGRHRAEIPALYKSISIPEFRFQIASPLFDNLPKAISDTTLRTMEEYGQGFGSILYRTVFHAIPVNATLIVDEAHDYAQIFLNGEYIGTLDRRLGEKEIRLPAVDGPATVDILVEAMGRINFGRAIKDFKGIVGSVKIVSRSPGMKMTQTPDDWDVYLLPDSQEFYDSMRLQYASAQNVDADGRYPRGLYRATFTLPGPTAANGLGNGLDSGYGDTFLDFSKWGKGLVTVNGHPLGRIWEIGPQQTLYLPGAWLKKGGNVVEVFDIVGPKALSSKGLDKPIIDMLQLPTADGTSNDFNLDILDPKATVFYNLSGKGGWERHIFPESQKGRYTGLLISKETLDGADVASIAELYLLDENGERLPREGWRAVLVSSQQTKGNHTADKLYDLQESTYWQADPESVGEDKGSLIVIDLGSSREVSGIEILPRSEQGAPQAPESIGLTVGGK